MKLTNSDRDAFIKAVMDDVPTIDYDEVCREKVQKWALARAPETIKAAYAEAPNYLSYKYYCVPGSLCGAYGIGDSDCYEISKIDPGFNNELRELASLKDAQIQKNRELEGQLRGVIFSCTTLKKAKELLPEFEKYLPADRDSVVDRAMPVISNLVASLTEAGWPKDQPLTQGI